MMRRAGFKNKADAETIEKLTELQYLEQRGGKTGKIAIEPFLRSTSCDLWQFCMLDE